ncbi:MAG: hypothetical protein GY935_26475 [Gammaproteobacteria bacterium]|nr:hypothetical protein [Gammaproteobacteria bacterium]
MKLRSMLLGLVLAVSAVQADSITTIQLRNRPAVEVIPIVKPMLRTDDTISGHGFKIFLRAAPQTVAEVKDMIAALDSPIKMLQITVFQGSTRGLGELGLGANIRIESGNASVGIGVGSDENTTAGGSITYGSNPGHLSISSISTRKRLQNSPIHQVRVAEGNPAYIETGKQIPYFSGANWISQRGQGVTGGIEFKDVVTGFYVLPRVRGDNVNLEVSPFKNALGQSGGGNIDTSAAGTTITGPMGEWLLIGGVSEQLKRAQSGTGSYASTKSRSNESIWIRTDLVQR